MAESQRCSRCGEREVWAALFPVPTLRDRGEQLSVALDPARLCRECFHTEQQALAADDRRQLRDRLATLSSGEIQWLAAQLAQAAKEASPEEWRMLVVALRDAQTLRGGPWPPEIQGFFGHQGGDDRDPSA